jgi:hypothetical protein
MDEGAGEMGFAMKPLFSPRCDLLGWIDPGAAIFDTAMNYVAFVADGHAWSPLDCDWLGFVDVLTVFDRSGRAVAWSPERPLSGLALQAPVGRPMRPKTPMRPKRPLQPVRPLFPKTPLTGWSPLSFEEWLGRSPAGAEQNAGETRST